MDAADPTLPNPDHFSLQCGVDRPLMTDLACEIRGAPTVQSFTRLCVD
jgi:hypothetical protein